MFGTIRKHQTWLWAILIVLMSFGLIVFFSPDAKFLGGKGGQGPDLGSMNGRPIPLNEYMNAQREVMIAYYMRNNLQWPNKDEQTTRQLENETLSRWFMIHKMKEEGIQPSEKSIAFMMRQQIGDMPLAELEQKHLAPGGLHAGDYERFVRHEVGRSQLMAAAGVSGKFVRPPEAEALYRKENQESVVQLALFWASNFTDKVTITNGAIGGYYSNAMNLMRYRIPERTILGYVEFPNTNFYAEADKEIGAVTNLEVRLTEIYSRRQTNDPFFMDDKGVPLSEVDAKKKIRDADREQLARTFARKAANDFGSILIEPKSTPGLDPDANKVDNLDKLAAAKGMTVKTTKPFDPMGGLEGLEEFDAPTNHILAGEESFHTFVRKFARDLKEATPIRFSPVIGPHAVFIIARKGTVPGELPPLEKITDKVTTDYKNAQAEELARKAGATFGTNVTNGLVLKKSFEEICKAEGIKPVDVPAFSETTQSLTNFDKRVSLPMLQRIVRDLKVGEASPFIPFAREGSLIAYLKDRPKLDDAKVAAGMPEYMNQLRLYRQFEAFNQWFMKQATEARLTAPKRSNDMAGMPN